MRGNSGEVAILLIALIVGILAVLLVIAILYLLMLSKALSRCHPRNRTMSPGMVWLFLIPLFNVVWQYFVVFRVAESLQREYKARGLRRRGDFGLSVGTTSNALSSFGPIPYLGQICGLASLILRIVHWVQVASCSAELARDGRPVPPRFYDDDFDDVEDDRPRSRRRYDEDDDDDEDERPRRSSRDDDEDDDEDERPRRSSRQERD